MKRVGRKLAAEVRRRAGAVCEYCRFLESDAELPFVIDHVVARQHAGRTASQNLALACGFCNSHKGPNISGIDPTTGKQASLFNPRHDRWEAHFRLAGTKIVGLTATARATIHVLAMNHPSQIARREAVRRPNR